MASARSRVRYPWGTTPPRQRLRSVCASARKALDNAKSPGFRHLSGRISGAVKVTRPLLAAMQYLSRAGLRPNTEGQPLASDEVRVALDRVELTISDLAAASVFELSDRYRSFSEAVNALLDVAEQSLRGGIHRPLNGPTDVDWAAFEP